jgi:hypothetical protein
MNMLLDEASKIPGASFHCISWEWELPIALASTRRNEGFKTNMQYRYVKDNVVLVSTRSTDCIRAMTCDQYLKDHWKHSWTGFIVNLWELVELTEVDDSHFGTCSLGINYRNTQSLTTMQDSASMLWKPDSSQSHAHTNACTLL